jgi:hypothetical protein
MKKLLLISFFFVLNVGYSQVFRLRAKFEEVVVVGEKYQTESKRLIIFDVTEFKLTLYGVTTETFDLYEEFDIDENTSMFPGLDKEGNEFAIELSFEEEYIIVTIQTPTENEIGEFDYRRFYCKRIPD